MNFIQMLMMSRNPSENCLRDYLVEAQLYLGEFCPKLSLRVHSFLGRTLSLIISIKLVCGRSVRRRHAGHAASCAAPRISAAAAAPCPGSARQPPRPARRTLACALTTTTRQKEQLKSRRRAAYGTVSVPPPLALPSAELQGLPTEAQLQSPTAVQTRGDGAINAQSQILGNPGPVSRASLKS